MGDTIKIWTIEINHIVIFTLKLGTLPQSFIFVMYLCATINNHCHIFLLQDSLIPLRNMGFHKFWSIQTIWSITPKFCIFSSLCELELDFSLFGLAFFKSTSINNFPTGVLLSLPHFNANETIYSVLLLRLETLSMTPYLIVVNTMFMATRYHFEQNSILP